MKSVLAYSENLYKQSIKLMWILLAKQNAVLFEDSDVYFWSFRQFKIFINKSAVFTIIIRIHISQIFKKAMNSLQADKWMRAMNKKMQQNHEWNIYILVSLSKKKTALSEKWVYILKLNENEKIAWYKTKWVVKNFWQCKKVDYN